MAQQPANQSQKPAAKRRPLSADPTLTLREEKRSRTSVHDEVGDVAVGKLIRGYIRVIWQTRKGQDYDEEEFKKMMKDYEGREL
eukprot:9341715-Pyramimonas_sp.AAC.1